MMVARLWRLLFVVPVLAASPAHADPAPAPAEPAPVQVRAEMLTVTPATGPLMHILVHNPAADKFEGQIAVTFPKGWKVNKPSQPLSIERGQTARLPFAIEKGANSPENSYPLSIQISRGERTWKFEQKIVCASAPYLDIKIDKNHEDWKDSIPVTFTTKAKKTILRTAYTRKSLFLLIGVEEDAHRPVPPHGKAGEFDAVQIAIAPRDAVTPKEARAKSPRLELVFAAGETGGMRWYKLLWPDQPMEKGEIDLAKYEIALAPAASFSRKDGWSWYELAIPVKWLPGIEPDPGREFCLSVLVHDADGTGIRDWGEAAGLWPAQRNPNAWSRWKGPNWPAEGCFDSAIEWGFCSSAQ